MNYNIEFFILKRLSIMTMKMIIGHNVELKRIQLVSICIYIHIYIYIYLFLYKKSIFEKNIICKVWYLSTLLVK